MDCIQQVLEPDYAMFYTSKIMTNQLVPGSTFEQCRQAVNIALEQYGLQLQSWPDIYTNRVVKMVRAHVIFQNLTTEPIRKPLLIHQQNQQFFVDCGDTRLMALNQLRVPVAVSAVLTCKLSQAADFKDWYRVYNVKDLSAYTGIALKSSKVKMSVTEPDENYRLTWLEIGDASTAHHLHDPQQRLQMMQNYLDQQSVNFRFGPDWLQTTIQWQK